MWIVFWPGSPDPTRTRVAVHHDDPTKDRDRAGRLAEIAIAPVLLRHGDQAVAHHRGLQPADGRSSRYRRRYHEGGQ